MFKANYLTRLLKNNFNSNIVCLGIQLVEIVEFLETFLPSIVWYGSDISIISNTNNLFVDDKFSDYIPIKIGSSYELKKQSSKVFQFLSGVFIASKNEIFWPKTAQIYTENLTFRPLEINDIVLEIRAFDTTYFEIYSDNIELINIISKNYKSEIEECKIRHK
ncbi:hypothetical protein [Candidatus Protochlamydia naegleriophila]|nr:hypothetical protein [Candidatus Protochlamydia naegleriophila]